MTESSKSMIYAYRICPVLLDTLDTVRRSLARVTPFSDTLPKKVSGMSVTRRRHLNSFYLYYIIARGVRVSVHASHTCKNRTNRKYHLQLPVAKGCANTGADRSHTGSIA